VATINAVYVGFDASATLLHLFKHRHTNNTSNIAVTWNGKSTVAPTSAIVYLQVYNYDSTTWETIDSDSTTAVDTDFDLTAIINVSVGDYYDADNWLAFRVYQGVA
jgi:hypothetical protein